ncbi:MAG: shikimate dehydrogenase [Pseudomonadales bacterium]
MATPGTDRYAVIGNPIGHSLSPRIHSLFAEQTGQRLQYDRLLAPLDGFREAAAGFFAAGGRGLNVTVPFKLEAAAWVDELDEDARFAGAVNTIRLLPGGALEGFNTDGPGLVADLGRHVRSGVKLNILLLGAGGAARGVARPLARALASRLVIANRTPERAGQIAAALSAQIPGLEVSGGGLEAPSGAFDLVINASSAGLDDQAPAIDPALARGALCYDMVYGAETAFCRWARRAGARVAVDGLGMLVEQAALAFELWRGVRPETGPVLTALREDGST